MGDILTPSFKNPPVVETVVGVQFVPLEKWSIPHFGLFWNKVRAQFQRIEVRPPISTIGESDPAIRIEVRQTPNVRCWYIGPRPTELVQIQNDRFYVNWRQLSDEDKYPRYFDRVRPLFVEQWNLFNTFLKEEGISEPTIIQCEINYVNHIPKGEGWEVAADWDKIFTVCGDLRGEEFLPNPEARRFALNYPMPDGNGSLDVEAVRAIRARDAKDIIRFSITAKGKPATSTIDDICKWCDEGHDWVVKGFAELTHKDMHKRWDRER